MPAIEISIDVLPEQSLSTILDNEVIVLDSETTGLYPHLSPECDEYGPDRICSLSAILLKRTSSGGWEPVSQRTSRFNPERPINSYAAKVNHFFWSEGEEDTPSGYQNLRPERIFAEKLTAILEYIGPRLIVAHNASFDMAFLDAELARAGIEPLLGNFACTRAAFAERVGLGRNHPRAYGTKLDDLCSAYGIPRGARSCGHGAAVDAGLCAEGFAYLDYDGLMLAEAMENLPHRSHQDSLAP